MHIKRGKSLRAQFKPTIAKKFRNLSPEHALLCLLYITQTLNEISCQPGKTGHELALWLFIFKGLKLSPSELTGFLMRAHQPWEIGLVIAGCLQGEGTLTPTTGLCGSTVGVLTVVPLNRIFLDLKGRGWEIRKRCHAGSISTVMKLGLGWGCLNFGPSQCYSWAAEAWSVGLNQRLSGVGPPPWGLASADAAGAGTHFK